MSATGLAVFDKTLQTTNLWLDQIMTETGDDRRTAWRALGVVLRAVRDRLPIGLAAHLGAQLPLLVRGLYYDQWRATDQPSDLRTSEQFLKAVSDGMTDSRPVEPDARTRAVFHTLNHYVDPNQIEKVRASLPQPIRDLWPLSAADEGRPAPANVQ